MLVGVYLSTHPCLQALRTCTYALVGKGRPVRVKHDAKMHHYKSRRSQKIEKERKYGTFINLDEIGGIRNMHQWLRGWTPLCIRHVVDVSILLLGLLLLLIRLQLLLYYHLLLL